MDIQSQKARQFGFSLIEIAIVLVIIGLLLGGVMKGQTMVQNSKIKRIATDTQAVQSAINAYSDNYWQLPGDDARASAHFNGVANGAGANPGLIDGLFEPANLATDETAFAWNHLRCAELVKGECLTGAAPNILAPTNPVGGSLGIADGREPTGPTPVLGMAKKVICMGSIPSAYAQIYDTQQDDGVGNTGDVRGSKSGQNAATPGVAQAYAAAANETIHVCTGF